MPSIDVLVVGAGPVGLVTALSLAQNGLAIRVIDKLDQPAIGQRGAGIMPRTLEMYYFLGILDDIKKTGTGILPVLEHDSNGKVEKQYEMMERFEKTVDIPEPNPWSRGQDEVCSILREKLLARGIQVEFSTELLSYDEDEAGITAAIRIRDGEESKVRAKFIVGADGAKGTTRKLSGVSFLGDTKNEVKMLIGDLELFGLPSTHWFTFRDGDGTLMALRPTEHKDLFFLALHAPDTDFAEAMENPDYLQKKIRDISKRPDLKMGKVKTVASWRANIRMVDKFRIGRLFLAGDAAHVHSPTGGQGMNSGVLDAMNLSWKLALACKGFASLSLLDTYNEERLPIIAEMLQITTNYLDATFARNGKALTRGKELRQLGVHYRWSRIVIRESSKKDTEPTSVYVDTLAGQLHAGDRAPDASGLVDVATGSSQRLFDYFKPTHHTIIMLDPTSSFTELASRYPRGTVQTVAITSNAQSIPEVSGHITIHDSEGHLHRIYGMEQGIKLVIVRPDGFIGALLQHEDGVAVYFSHIFQT